MFTTKAMGAFLSIRATDTFTEICRIPISTRSVDFKFSPDDRSIIVCDGKSISQSEVDTGLPGWSLPYVTSATVIDLSPDGRRMLASTATRRAREYDISSKMPHLIREISNAAAPFFADGGRRILAFGDDWRVIDDEHAQRSSEIQMKSGPYLSIQTTPGGRLALLAASHLFSIDGNNPSAAGPQCPAPVFGQLEASGRYILTFADKGVKFLDSTGERKPFSVRTPETISPWACAANPSGTLIAYVKSPTEVSILDAASGMERVSLGGVGGPGCMNFSANGDLLAVADWEGVVTVWHTGDWRRISSGRLGRNYPNCVSFSDDGEKVACGLGFGDCGILDIRTGACLRLQGHSEGVNSVNWSHDGSRLATGSDDKTVRLWDPSTGSEVGIVGEHGQGVMAVWFMKGDRTWCSIDLEGNLKLMETSDQL